MTTAASHTKIAYIGPNGAGLGFALSGIAVHEATTGEDLLSRLRRLKAEGTYGIILVDESLAASQTEGIANLNKEPLPAIILLPNPLEAKHLAADNLQKLMIRAVGSDIFT